MLNSMPVAFTRVRAWLREHPGLAVSALSLLTVVAKLWAVSHGDMRTIASLLTAQGPVNVAIAALVAGVPTVGWVVLAWAGIHLAEAVREGDKLREPLITLAVSLVVALVVSPVSVVLLVLYALGVLVVLSGAVLLMRRLFKWRGWRLPPFLRGSPSPGLAIRWGLLLVVVVAWLAVAFSTAPWLPAERIDTATREGTIAGYVLTEDERWTLVMREADRSVVLIPTPMVNRRQVCRLSDADDRSLPVQLLWDEEVEYPSCS